MNFDEKTIDKLARILIYQQAGLSQTDILGRPEFAGMTRSQLCGHLATLRRSSNIGDERLSPEFSEQHFKVLDAECELLAGELRDFDQLIRDRVVDNKP